MPGAGELRDRVRFDSPTAAEDDFGNAIQGWTEEGTVWAQIKPLKGGEQVLASRLSGVQPVLIMVRYSSMTARTAPDWRAVDARSGMVYAIRSAADMERRRTWITLTCEAGVAT